ncbi:MAG: DNA helicase RecQ [Crocinitomicaceae bacterium]|nr:DNA helicase RecQ [Crocinitomicaceae bacterium]
MEVVSGSNLGESLKKFFGFDKFKGKQEEIIQNVLSGKNTFVIMPTGGGKSLCYQLPALMLEGTAIIVSPLIALMKNQVDAIRHVSDSDDVAHFLNSSLSKAEIKKVKEDILAKRTKLLYVAPESLTKRENIDFLNEVKISFFAIDEAHCISEWGHDFRPEYRRLREIFEEISSVPIIALTATATPKVQHDIQKNLNMMDATIFKMSFNRDNLYYEVLPKQEVEKNLIRFVKQRAGQSGIVYCLSRKKVEEIAEVLQVNGVNALPYHAGLDSAARAKHQDMFLMEETDVIVATIAFGMGIDKPDVRFVVHHDIPKSLESYYQETGRAGRDGGEGHCLTFYSYKDIEKLEKFLQGKPISEQEVGKQLLHEMVSYAETSICRRKYILHYFGEEYDDSGCTNMCDNCRTPREKFEGKEDVELVLKTIEFLSETQKAKYICNLLAGIENSDIIAYKHDKCEYFGKGKEKGHVHWNAVIRQSLVHGFLTKEIESYGTLKISQKGKEFIASPKSIMLLKERDYTIEGEENIITNQKSAGTTDEVLFKMLLDLRKKLSKDKNVPPFVIFQEPSLSEMATQYPITKEELTNIVGVGQGKAIRYGSPFTELIAKYVDDNNIERPQDFVVKSIANKSAQKVQIIQNVDRKMSLELIATSQGKAVPDLIDEIEAIVQSGTKMNLDYYINDIIDEEDQEDIYDYFMEAETDCIEEAHKEFDGDFDEEHLRLMRIKFMSEMAN